MAIATPHLAPRTQPPSAAGSRAQPFEHLLLDFLAYLEFERGLSRNTLEAYRSDLLQYGEWLGRSGHDPLGIGHAELSAFTSELASGRADKPAAAPATLQRKIACLRSFYRHLRRTSVL
ncbi:MAG: site-specific integrase, partial [Gaiellaceae bacterium]